MFNHQLNTDCKNLIDEGIIKDEVEYGELIKTYVLCFWFQMYEIDQQRWLKKMARDTPSK